MIYCASVLRFIFPRLAFWSCLAAFLFFPPYLSTRSISAAEEPPLGWQESPGISPNKLRGPVCRGSFIPTAEPALQSQSADQGNIKINAGEVTQAGENKGDILLLSGGVRLGSQDLKVSGEQATYDKQKQEINLIGEVTFDSADILARAKEAVLLSLGTDSRSPTFSLRQAVFSHPQLGLHGSAGLISVSNEGAVADSSVIYLEDYELSFCEPGERTWHFSGKKLWLDLATSKAKARNLKFHLGDAPVLFLPYLVFPVGDKPQSGFLFPSFAFDDSNGFTYSQPVYLRFLPNLDSTIHANFIGRRGLLWEQDLRWLTRAGQGEIGFGYLGKDALTGERRTAEYLKFSSSVNNGWSGELEWVGLRDRDYLRDLPSVIGTDYDFALRRQAQVRYADKRFDWRLGLTEYRSLDNQPDASYSNLPYMSWDFYSGSAAGFYLTNQFEYRTFTSDAVPSTPPEILAGDNSRLHNRFAAGWYGETGWGRLHPRLAWQGLEYKLDPGAVASLSGRPSPDFSLQSYNFDIDASLTWATLATDSGWWNFGTRLYALTSSQDSSSGLDDYENLVNAFNGVDFFDTGWGRADYDYLFSPHRWTGVDGVLEEERISLGVESDVLAPRRGRLLRFRYGQIIANDLVGAPATFINEDDDPWAADLDLRIGKRGFLRLDAGGINGASDYYGANWRYAIGSNNGVSLSYRWQRDNLYQDAGEQLAGNFIAYPAPRWSIFSGWRYKFDEDRFSNALLGFGYENCCFTTRVGILQKINTDANNPRLENGFGITFNYKPLGSVNFAPVTGISSLSGNRFSDIYEEYRQ